MIKIYELRQFNLKFAEQNSVYLLREIRNKARFPLSLAFLEQELEEFNVSLTDLESMERGIGLIPATIEAIKTLLDKEEPLYEAINLERARALLKGLQAPLEQSLAFSQEIGAWQEQGHISLIASTFNGFPTAKTGEEKARLNQGLNELFTKILRGENFQFQYLDLVNEAQVAQIAGLEEGMEKGFLFHTSLEEEMAKVPFEIIQKRIPGKELAENFFIGGNIKEIKRGIERAYGVNQRMVQMALLLYSYLKWAKEQKGR